MIVFQKKLLKKTVLRKECLNLSVEELAKVKIDIEDILREKKIVAKYRKALDRKQQAAIERIIN